MRGCFFGCGAKTEEEYRKGMRTRTGLMAVLLVLGIATLVVALLATAGCLGAVDEALMSFYLGVGTGVTAGAVVLLIRQRWMLARPERVRRAWIRDTDERTQEISRRAMVVASYCLLVAMYVAGLIGGLFYPILTKVLCVGVAIYMLAYAATAAVLNRKM